MITEHLLFKYISIYDFSVLYYVFIYINFYNYGFLLEVDWIFVDDIKCYNIVLKYIHEINLLLLLIYVSFL